MNISTRTAGIAGIVAGLGYILQAIIGLIKPQTEVFSGTSDYVLEAIFVIALIATIFALLGLQFFLNSRISNVTNATFGSWLTLIGTGLMAISALATLFAGKNSLGISFLAGLFLALIGYVVMGITILRAKILPLWSGLALMLGFSISIFLSVIGGGILFALVWLGMGYFLLKQ